jgi:hypothetical protein
VGNEEYCLRQLGGACVSQVKLKARSCCCSRSVTLDMVRAHIQMLDPTLTTNFITYTYTPYRKMPIQYPP